MTHETQIQQMKTTYTRDIVNKRMTVVREFAAPVDRVWQAWTDSKMLEQWWAPKPWKAVTKAMDFREGGQWLYYMQGPDGTKTYDRIDYKSVKPRNSFSAFVAFCDENGVINQDLPRWNWTNKFTTSPTGTRVEVEIQFASEADLLKIAELGFQEGFAKAHDNLDQLLAAG